jgi:hypothetical protein
MRRVLILLVAVGLVIGACGGGEVELSAESIEAAADCDDLVGSYEVLVADLVAAEGGRTLDEFAEDLSVRPPTRWRALVIAFLSDELTMEDVAALSSEISAWDGVWEVVFFSKAESLEEYRAMFADFPSLIEVVEADPSTIPASLRIGVTPDARVSIAEQLESVPGIREVNTRDVALGVTEVALTHSGLDSIYTLLVDQADRLDCTLEGIARSADLAEIDPQGVAGEWIIETAKAGMPVPADP